MERKNYVFVLPAGLLLLFAISLPARAQNGWVGGGYITLPNDFGYDFGTSVAMSGNTIVVGAQQAASNGPGAVYVYVNFVQVATLTASDGVVGDRLGVSVSISGNTIVAGAPDARIGPNSDQGAAYVFVEPPTGWTSMTETAKLTVANGATDDALGRSVGIDGNTIVAGVPGYNGIDAGEVLVFVQPASGWVSGNESAALTATGGAVNHALGTSVAIQGNTVVAGAPGSTYSPNGVLGAAYVFEEPAGGWQGVVNQTAKLTSTRGANTDRLGESVGLSGSTVVAGAPGVSTNRIRNQGLACVYVEPQTGWANMTETADLYNLHGNPEEQFGASVAVNGTAVVAGAPGYYLQGRTGETTGAAYVYTEPPSGWVTTSTYSAGWYPNWRGVPMNRGTTWP